MINIIKADLYKYFKRPFIYMILIILVSISIAIPLILKSIDKTVGTRMNTLNIFGSIMPFASIVVIIFASILLEEYSEHTLKNILPCNISKSSFIIGKFIVQILVCISLFVISLLFFILALMFLNPGEGYTTLILLNFIIKFLSGIPIYIAGIAAIDFFVVIFKNEVLVYIFYFMITIILPSILKLMEEYIWNGFEYFEKYTFISALRPLSVLVPTSKDMYFAITLGIVYTIVISTANVVLFYNQEIK